MRTERGAALLAHLYSASHMKHPPAMAEYMPHADKPPPISLEEAMKEWA